MHGFDDRTYSAGCNYEWDFAKRTRDRSFEEKARDTCRYTPQECHVYSPESHEVRHSVRSVMSPLAKTFTPDGVSRLSGFDL